MTDKKPPFRTFAAETRECHKCRGSGKYLIPSCDMELPAFSNICDVCGGSGRVSLPAQPAKEKPDAP